MAFLSREVHPARVILGVVAVALLAILICLTWRTVNAPAWESLRPDMTPEQVVSVLGPPESKDRDEIHSWLDEEWSYHVQNHRVRLWFNASGLQIVDIDGSKGDPLWDYRH